MMSDSSVNQPPLSPELNLSRSFKRGVKQKNRKSSSQHLPDENNKKELSTNYKKIDYSTYLKSSDTVQSAVNDIDSLLEIEQQKKSLYERISLSKKISTQESVSKCLDNVNQTKNTVFCQLKTNEQLELTHRNIGKSVLKINCVNNLPKSENFSELSRLGETEEVNISCLRKSTKSVINSDSVNGAKYSIINDDKMKSSISNIFKDESFDDLKSNNELGGFSKASSSISFEYLKKASIKTMRESNSTSSREELGINHDLHGYKLPDSDFASINHSNQKYTKGLSAFKDEDFSDLQLTRDECPGFQKASFTIKNCKIFDGLPFEEVSDSTGSHESNLAKDVTNNGKNSTFDSCKQGISGYTNNIKAPIKDSLKKEYSDTSKTLISSIFKDEDFTDLKTTTANAHGFQKASVKILNNKFEKSSDRITATGSSSSKFEIAKNIFADEDFSDLQLPITSNSITTKPCEVHNTNVHTFGNNSELKKDTFNSGFNHKRDVKKKSYADIFKDIDLSDITPIPSNSFGNCKAASKFNNKSCLYGGFKKRGYVCENKMEENDVQIENSEWIASSGEIGEFQGFGCSDQDLAIALGKKFCDNVGESDEFLLTKFQEVNKKRKFSESDVESSSSKKIKCISDENQSFLPKPKKRLGTPFTPSITMSSTNLNKAKSFFREELSVRPLRTSTPVLSKCASVTHNTPIRYSNLTPIKEENSNISTRLFFANESTNLSLTEKTLAPNKFSLNKPTEGTVYNWLEQLDAERRLLEERLRVVLERHDVLQKQEQAVVDRHVKRKPGCLYLLKTQNERRTLRSIGELGSVLDSRSHHKFLNMINPQNAGLVHFGTDRGQSFILTSEGAKLVPNSKGQIGVSEIEHCFSFMEGVDSKLLPEGWIKNHYKWIVWKLASYERMYPQKFEGVFSLENVIQQLKYRYDRELDNAERPALKKIFQTDDSAQKRLVLCISSIKKLSEVTRTKDGYELELTDGWYPIRAVIDKPLSNQIKKGRIKIGTKIITCGAEMMNNSDGCDPLEASSDICLRLFYNSTRRALWWTKLGYQRDPSAFRIPLSSVDLEGGRIGCIQFYVARVYPVKYLEKLNEHNVWRNFKAEARKATIWESEQCSKLEQVLSNLDKTMTTSSCDRPVLFENIESIEDPEMLYTIMKNSNDPEKINDMLTSSQRSSLLAYQINESSKEQSRLLNEVQKKVGIAEKRNVTPLLRIRIVDANESSEHDHDFYVWDPQEYHLSIFKEGCIVSAFNVNCNANWGLTAGKTTKFKEESKSEIASFKHFARKVTKIDDLGKNIDLVFKEFDTVGIVIRIKIAQVQEVWFSSISGRLLLIKIYESTQNILLLDSIKEGDVAVASNVIFKETKDDYVFAIADHYSIISKYSKLSHLQEESVNLGRFFEKIDLPDFIKSALSKIDQIETKSSISNYSSLWNGGGADDGMECSQMTTTDIALLECINKLEA